MNNLPEIFKTYPAVYAVGDRYIVTVAVNEPCTMWIKVGNELFFDDSNGILRTASLTHKMEFPSHLLDETREYTVFFRKVIDRKPYFSEMGEEESYTSLFRPICGDTIRIFHIADAHNRITGPVAAAQVAGEHDLLILNGDIPNHSGKIEYFSAIHRIAGEITRGEYPVIFSRGNHDLRGIYAEMIADHTPTDNGRSYFSVRTGPIWALVLDCGEDKPDKNAEYGHTICCEDFRKRQTKFIEKIVGDGDSEYNADGVKYKLIISHIPFNCHFREPFNIEEDRYSYWCKLIRDNISPDLMICGHTHKCVLFPFTDEAAENGQPCSVVTASKPIHDSEDIICGDIVVSPEGISIRFVDNHGAVHGEHRI